MRTCFRQGHVGEPVFPRQVVFVPLAANSLVQIEAACQNTPTLFLEGAKTAATVTPGVNGYVSPAGEENYARAIMDILADAEGYERVAKATFRDLYINWDDVIRDVYKDYCMFDHS